MALSDTYENEIVDVLHAAEQDPVWLIPDLLLQGSMVCLAGEPGAGKSYVSYTAGLAVATGIAALDGIIPPGKPKTVIYFDQENSRQDRDKYLRRSWHGLARNGKLPDVGLLLQHFHPVHFALGDDDWAEIAAEYIALLCPQLVIFDTATPCFNIGDENDNAEAVREIKKIRQLMALGDPVVSAIVLRHAKIAIEKGGRRTMRGAKSWHNAADGIMYQVKQAGRPRGDGLSRTRLEPDKTRAYGLSRTIYITPEWTEEERTGLFLHGSYTPDKEHKRLEQLEDEA